MPRIAKRHAEAENAAPDLPSDPLAKAKELFARRLYRLMMSKGWNQAELGRRADLGRDVINKYINARALPTPESVQKLAIALGIPTIRLYPGGDETGLEATQAEIPPVSMKVTGNGKALLQVNMEMDQNLAIQILGMLPRAGA